MNEPACQCCGNSTEFTRLTLTFSKNESTCLCDLCAGLIKAGYLRPETVDGKLRYRQWWLEWVEGALVPDRGQVA